MKKLYYIKNSNPLQVAQYYTNGSIYADRDGNGYIYLDEEMKLITEMSILESGVSLTTLGCESNNGYKYSPLGLFWTLFEYKTDPVRNRKLKYLIDENARYFKIKRSRNSVID